ncbi:hypothetical protein [Jannaschia marina]|uniref:hypothetical protein n=1 Tax=Jannaschia marina TaxID=2741674 RepID=UPI0015CCA02F|nr:hypothetical protein [Jannaschia marina]
MSQSDAYVSLMAGLPGPERLFRAKQPPLSRLRLEKRLAVLAPEDRAVLDRIERLLDWGGYAMDEDAGELAHRARAATLATRSATLRAVIRERLDLRTAVAALRMRRDGAGPPPPGWSPSRLARIVAANWSDPTFALELRVPGLRELAALIDARAPLPAERKILEIAHAQLSRHAMRHHFDLEAVVLYVLRWTIFDRWARADARAATARFDALTAQALAGFTGLPRQER